MMIFNPITDISHNDETPAVYNPQQTRYYI